MVNSKCCVVNLYNCNLIYIVFSFQLPSGYQLFIFVLLFQPDTFSTKKNQGSSYHIATASFGKIFKQFLSAMTPESTWLRASEESVQDIMIRDGYIYGLQSAGQGYRLRRCALAAMTLKSEWETAQSWPSPVPDQPNLLRTYK